MSELQSNGVQIYQFPTDDETVAETNKSMNVSAEVQIRKGNRDNSEIFFGVSQRKHTL